MKANNLVTRQLDNAIIALCLAVASCAAFGEIVIPPQPGDLLSGVVEVNVIQDSNTHVYTYQYSVGNDVASQQEIWFFALELPSDGGVPFNLKSPGGWSHGIHEDRPIISWAATGYGNLPPPPVDDGNVLPSPFQVKQGQTLTGFSFDTLTPPGDAIFYLQGFTKLPQVTGDAEEIFEAGFEIKDFTEDSFSGQTTGPTTGGAFLGGRRPAVDGFLAFLNLKKNDVFVSPATIVIKFAVGGENVDRNSFHASLNGVDVTGAFVPDDTYGGDFAAVFAIGTSPLAAGRNVLIATVNGVVPGTSRTAADVDRVTFSVN